MNPAAVTARATPGGIEMTHIDRRKALAVVAAASAAVALTAPALASVGDDAALRELWQRFIESDLRIAELSNAQDEASFRAMRE